MRGELELEGRGQLGHSQCLSNTTHHADIGLPDICPASEGQIAKRETGEQPLTSGNWYGRRTPHLGQAWEVCVNHGFLKPGQIMFLECPGKLHCVLYSGAAMGINHDVYVWTYGVPYLLDPRYGPAHHVWVIFPASPDLDRLEALLDVAPSLIADLSYPSMAATGISTHTLSHSSAD